MSEFINTIDALGDDVVFNSIVDRSITEIKDDVLTTIGEYAFHQCLSLITADFPFVTEIGRFALNKCTSLQTANFPNVITIKDYAFGECKNLKTINFPELTSAGSQCFNQCSVLTDIKCPKLKVVSQYMVSNCANLKTVNFPSSTSIYSNAFYYCTSLETAEFAQVTSVANNAFTDCSVLTAVILRSETMATLGGTNAFIRTPIASGTGYIYVPRALLDDTDATKDYRRATNWATYSTQFRALEDWTVDGTITGELDWAKIEAAA